MKFHRRSFFDVSRTRKGASRASNTWTTGCRSGWSPPPARTRCRGDVRLLPGCKTASWASVRECHLSLRRLALRAVREGLGQLVLREIEDRDLGVLFEHWRDRDAIRMAAFTSPEQNDRTGFERRWARLRSDDSTTNRVVELDGRVVGHIASFDLEGHREGTYWIGREDWGRGIATRALREFLQLEATRPLYARPRATTPHRFGC